MRKSGGNAGVLLLFFLIYLSVLLRDSHFNHIGFWYNLKSPLKQL